jgi:hypothetical protein
MAIVGRTGDSFLGIAPWLREMLDECDQARQERLTQTAPGALESFEAERSATVRMMERG